jgi:glucose-1-phosphate thymidylyltransferase
MVDEGAKFRTFPVSAWEDTGTWDAVLHANRYLLRKMDQHEEPYMVGTSLVIPPAFIAPGANVENSVVGPYASISEGATVSDSIVRNSIISPEAIVTGTTLFGSLVGERATVEGGYRTLNVGDDSIASFIDAKDAEIDETFK